METTLACSWDSQNLVNFQITNKLIIKAHLKMSKIKKEKQKGKNRSNNKVKRLIDKFKHLIFGNSKKNKTIY